MAHVSSDDERIRLALAAGDPAAQDSSLSLAERQAMLAHLRASVERPVPAPGRWTWMRPLVASTFALALLLVAWNWPRREAPPAGAIEPARPVASGGVTAPSAPSVPHAAATVPHAPGPVRTAPTKAVSPLVGTSTERLARVGARPADAVRMIAKGGTKIVWIVNPDARF